MLRGLLGVLQTAFGASPSKTAAAQATQQHNDARTDHQRTNRDDAAAAASREATAAATAASQAPIHPATAAAPSAASGVAPLTEAPQRTLFKRAATVGRRGAHGRTTSAATDGSSKPAAATHVAASSFSSSFAPAAATAAPIDIESFEESKSELHAPAAARHERSEEDKENTGSSGSTHRRDASNDSGASHAEQLEAEAGRASKRIKITATSATTVAPAAVASSSAAALHPSRTSRPAIPLRAASVSGLSSGAAVSASIFNFAPGVTKGRTAAATAIKPSAHHAPIAAARRAGGGAANAAADALSTELHGVKLSNGVASSSSSAHAVPVSCLNVDDGDEDPDVRMGAESPIAAARPATAANAAASSASSSASAAHSSMHPPHPHHLLHHAPQTRSQAASPAFDMPLHSLSISSSISPHAFGGLSLGEPANPFSASASTSAPAASSISASQAAAAAAAASSADDRARIDQFKASRQRSTKDGLASVKRDRAAVLAAAMKAESQKSNGGELAGSHRADIKSHTTRNAGRIHTAATNGAAAASTNPQHLPMRPNVRAAAAAVHVKPPPVPLFHQPASAASSSSSGAASAHTPAAFSERDSRVPITSSASHAQVQERESERRAARLQQTEGDAKRGRERTLQARREMEHQAEMQRQADQQQQAAATQAAAVQEQQRAQQQAQALFEQQQRSATLAAATIAAAAAAASSSRTSLRRSARYSLSPRSAAASAASAASAMMSPSPSPSPSPSSPFASAATMATPAPAPRNRFVAPPMTVGWTGGADGTTPAPRTRSATAAASSPRTASPVPVPAPAAATAFSRAAAEAQSAAALAASIAARKASETAAAASRLRDRQASLQQQAHRETVAARERDEWQDRVSRGVAQRARGKTYLQLLQEFAPALRAELPTSSRGGVDYDAQRKAMRKAMARFHPDKHTGSPTRNRLEAEEIFQVLKKAYDELQTLCR